MQLESKYLFSKEPETLKWIDEFDNKNKTFFGTLDRILAYIRFTSLKHHNLKVISFEPSTSNLRILSRNISINKMKQITICQLPLGQSPLNFNKMNETNFLRIFRKYFRKDINFEGKK